MDFSTDLANVSRFEFWQPSGWNLLIQRFPGYPFGDDLPIYLTQLPEGFVTQCTLLKAEGLPADIQLLRVNYVGDDPPGVHQVQLEADSVCRVNPVT